MSWYWQKDLRKNGDAKDAWEPYSSEVINNFILYFIHLFHFLFILTFIIIIILIFLLQENTKIERAFKKDQKTLKLSEKYKIDFKDMIQFRPEVYFIFSYLLKVYYFFKKKLK